MARAHYGFFDYHGLYAFADPEVYLNDDSARGQWYGLEANVVRALGARHLVTAGVEFQDNFSHAAAELRGGAADRLSGLATNHSERLALFVQDEITLSKRLRLHVGLREDWYSTFGYQTSPRLALIYDDGQATTLKLLHGRAFRAPDEFELHYTGSALQTNPDLGPETIRTTELVLERKLRRGLHLNASAYVNALDNLISLEQDPADGRFRYVNAGRSDSVGAEVGLDVELRQGPSGRLELCLADGAASTPRASRSRTPRATWSRRRSPGRCSTSASSPASTAGT